MVMPSVVMPSECPDPRRSSTARTAGLANPELLRLLAGSVRRRVPPADAEDLIQSTLADALEAPFLPEDDGKLRRWVFGIAKNKIAGYYRLGQREIAYEPPTLEGVSAAAAAAGAGAEPDSSCDLLRWAEGMLPENHSAQQTFDWMLREGEGEKLESIAREAKLPAPQVRKRISRLRQHLKRKWRLELAAVAALALLGIVSTLWFHQEQAIGPDQVAVAAASDSERASRLRRGAIDACAAGDFAACLENLDRAAAIDPSGEGAENVRSTRELVRAALREGLPVAPSPELGTANEDSPKASKGGAPSSTTPAKKSPPLPSKPSKSDPVGGTTSRTWAPAAPDARAALLNQLDRAIAAEVNAFPARGKWSQFLAPAPATLHPDPSRIDPANEDLGVSAATAPTPTGSDAGSGKKAGGGPPPGGK